MSSAKVLLLVMGMSVILSAGLAQKAEISIGFIQNVGQFRDQYARPDTHQPIFGGGAGDAFLARFSPCNEPLLDVPNGGYLCLQSFFALELNFSEAGPYTFTFAIDGVEQPPVTTSDSTYILSFPPNAYQDSVVITSMSSGDCAGTITGLPFIKVVEPLSNTPPVIECSADNQTYRVSFTLSGELEPYLPIDPDLGAFSGNQYVTEDIPSNEPFILRFTTALGCDTLIVAGTSGCTVECPDLEMNISSNSPQCTVQDLELNASPGASSYRWTGPNNFTSDEQNPVLDNPGTDFSGTYQLVYTYGNGCTGSLTLEHQVVRAPRIDELVILPENCGGDGTTVTIRGRGVGTLEYYIYSISFAEDDSIPFTSDSTFAALSPGSHVAYIRDATGCVSIDLFEIEEPDGPSIADLEVSPPDCGETNGAIRVIVQGGTAPYEFSINDGGTFQSDNFFENLPSGDYPILIRDQSDCMVMDWATVPGGGTPPVIDEILIEQAACAVDQNAITITVEDNSTPLAYSIDGVNFQSSNRFTDLSPGIYTVIIQDVSACSVTEVINIPSLDVLAIERVVTRSSECLGNTGRLEVMIRGGTGQILYQLDTLIQTNGEFSRLASGNYLLTVTDASGCTQSEEVNIGRGECPIYIPNAFSPNEDGGNDRFAAFAAAGINGQVITYQIFNRWGNQIFESNDFPLDETGQWWDGHFQGQRAVAGTYVYYIVIELEGGRRIVEQGEVNLVR